MKQLLWSFAIISCFLLSCSEPEEQKPVINIKNSPTCVYAAFENVAGTGWVHRYYFFDLNHKETKDKKYFVTEFISHGDSMRVVKEPRSMDSLGLDFPAEIMEYPGLYGIGFWVNADYIVRHTPDRSAFYKDFAPKNPNDIYYFMNNKSIAGNMAGSWPNANSTIHVPLGTGPYWKANVFFYFKHGLCLAQRQQFASPFDEIGTYIDERLTLLPIDEVFPLTSSYEWETVVSVIQRSGTFSSFLFFDFKKWRYFTWKEGQTDVIGNTTYRTLEYGDYKDLDKMLKWPEGWGKP